MNLSSTWIIEPVFDFEYKKYQLLAYLQEKNKALDSLMLFPHMEELGRHLQLLQDVLNRKDQMDDQFRKELEGIDPMQLELKYRQLFNTNEGLDELMCIVNYSNDKLSACYDSFVSEANSLRNHIKLDLIGLLPGYLKEGFLLIRQNSGIYLFSYLTKPLLDSEGDVLFNYQYIQKYPSSKIYQEHSIKKEVIDKYRNQFDHPALFSVTSNFDLPIYETLLPLSENELKKWVKSPV